jgi:hypothetical protein
MPAVLSADISRQRHFSCTMGARAQSVFYVQTLDRSKTKNKPVAGQPPRGDGRTGARARCAVRRLLATSY